MENSTTTEAEEAIHPVLLRTTEFSDRLSPMLVKELRQGLKGISFIILFIAIQVVLAIFIFGASFADSYDDTGRNISTMVFFCLSLATLAIQPLRGITAISAEIKEKTIDLMVMTRLSAWRIAYGKWISLVSQSALIIIAVMPYLILRYFFGGMQLFPELMLLFTIFCFSCGITALMIGISAIPSFIFRGLLGLGIIFFIVMGSSGVFLSGAYGFRAVLELCSFSSAETIIPYSIMFLFNAYIGWLALDFAASAIAPAAENRASIRRLVGLGVFAIFIIGFMFVDEITARQSLPIFLMVVASPILVITLTERTFIVPSICAGFLRRGLLGKISGYFLYPGWAAGLNYFALLFLITLACNYLIPAEPPGMFSNFLRETLFTIIPISFCCLLFPLVIVKLFFPRTASAFLFYIGASIASSILIMLVGLISDATNSYDLALLFAWNPPTQYLMFSVADSSYRQTSYTSEMVTFIAYTSLLGYWLICLARSRKAWKHIHQNETAAKKF